MRAALDAPTARGVAERLMYGALDMYSCPENPNGCLGVITSVACGAEAEFIRGAVLERGAAAKRAMLERFARAKEEGDFPRSEEHTSELQSLMRNSYAVFCLKKKNKITKE